MITTAPPTPALVFEADPRHAAIGSSLADTLFKQAFQGPRDPRSPSYRLGCIAALRYRLAGASLRCPYLPATAEADAWYAGTEEGHAIFRRYEAATKDAA